MNQASVQAVDASRWKGKFVKPLYDSYCFAQIPFLIPTLFGVGDGAIGSRLLGPLAGTYDTVILILIDGFGWRFFQQYQERYPFLRRFTTEGTVTKLTSQFPSTTAAHITTIHTGLSVGQSGIYEWFIYEPSLDAVIVPLQFAFIGDTSSNTLQETGVRPENLFPRHTLYQSLRAQGINSYVYGSQAFTPSPFTNVVSNGAVLRPFVDLRGGLRDLVETTQQEAKPAYHYLYFGGIDSTGHHRGPESAEFSAEVDSCFRELESIVYAGLRGKMKNALLLMTADHGQIQIDPRQTIYLNRDIPTLDSWLRRSRQGRPMRPSGYCRDLVLHLSDAHLEEAHAQIRDHLDGRALVCLVRDLVAEGFFGAQPVSATFSARIGNLMVIPYEDTLVWWDAPNYPRPTFRGYHGGLTPQEMETEILSCTL